MNHTCNDTMFWAPSPWGLGGGKRSNIIKSQLQSQFQRFLNQTLCVFSQIIERYKTYYRGFSFGPLGHAQGFGNWGAGRSKI